MAEKKQTYVEWQKQAAQVFEVGFGALEELIRAATALQEPSTPVIELHQLTQERPPIWTDVSSGVTFSNVGVVDDTEDDGTTVILADGAVQFTVEADPIGEAPLPGDNYSFLVVANRADDPTLQVSERVWLRILP